MRLLSWNFLCKAILLGLAMTVGGLTASAQDMAKMIEYRQNLMKSIGANAGDIVLMLKGQVPFNAKHVEAHAESIHAMSALIVDATPKGSGQEAGKTRAKDEIWKEWDDFKKYAGVLQTESAKLIEVAKAGDPKTIGDQVGVMGKQACGACHEEFRVPAK